MIPLVIATLLATTTVYHLVVAIHTLYFHTLSHLPGPKIWLIFPILPYIHQCRGTFDAHLLRFHTLYGPTVRFGPSSVSFTSAAAWKDIYGATSPQWIRPDVRPPGSPANILFSNDVDHARIRKCLSGSFSERSVLVQEEVTKAYLGKMMAMLKEKADEEGKADVVMWYNLCIFDVVWDLAFGEPSGCLEAQKYTPFIRNVFRFMKFIPYIYLAKSFPLIWKIIGLVLGSTVKKNSKGLENLSNSVIAARLNGEKNKGRNDFIEAMIKSRDEEKVPLTESEMSSTALILFVAASETVSTLLSGVTYYLLKNPEAHEKLVKEACLEEGLRIYPPAPTTLMRRAPKDVVVAGQPLPAGTEAGVFQFGANMSEENFHEPKKFVPERWLASAADVDSAFAGDIKDARQPFSIGPRGCIGKNLAYHQMRVVLARMLWNFDLDLMDKEQDWAKQKAYQLWEKHPLICSIKLRDT